MKEKIKNLILSAISTLIEGLLTIKAKTINMITGIKIKILDSCDDIHQMVTEGDEELIDRFGIRTVRLMWGVIITVSLLGFIALLSVMF